MFIQKLTLTNFCNIQHREFTFTPGINLITGTNGSGKSTILKALSYLILNSTEKSISDYVNWNAKSFELWLEFLIDNKRLTLESSWEGKSSARLLQVEKGPSYRNSEVTEYLATKFDPTLCKYSSFSSQGDLDFIYATPSVRRDLLKTIYSLEFDEQLRRVEEETEMCKRHLAEYTKAMLQIEAELGVEEFTLEPLPFSAVEAQAMRGKAHILTLEKSRLQAEIDLAQKQIEEYKAADKQLSASYYSLHSMRETEIRAREKEERILASLPTIIESSPSIAAWEAQLASIVIRRLPSSIPEQATLQEAMTALAVAKAEQTQATADLQKVASGVCPTCNRPFDLTDIDRFRVAVEQADQRVEKLSAEIGQLQTTVADYLASVEQNEKQKMTKDSYQQAIEKEKATLQATKEKQQIYRETSTAAILAIDSRLSTINAQIEVVEKQMEELQARAPVSSKTESSERRVHDLTIDVSLLETNLAKYDQIAMTNEKVEARNVQLREKKQTLEADYTKQQKKKDTETAQVELLDACKKVLTKDLPNFILERLAVGLETSANEFLDRAYNGKYHIKLIESKSGIDVVYGELDKPVVLASGAEKSLINLGIKLGLAKISGMGVLFLDEVDAYMADDIATEVFEVFEELIAEQFINQIFVISHKETVKELLEERFKATVFTMDR